MLTQAQANDGFVRWNSYVVKHIFTNMGKI